MAFKLTRNIKIAVICSDGELVIEFRRPSIKEKNRFIAEQLDIKTEGAARLDELDALRIAMYDAFAVGLCVERDGKKEDVVDEDEKPIGPKDLPDDIKIKAALRAFEMMGVVSKNF